MINFCDGYLRFNIIKKHVNVIICLNKQYFNKFLDLSKHDLDFQEKFNIVKINQLNDLSKEYDLIFNKYITYRINSSFKEARDFDIQSKLQSAINDFSSKISEYIPFKIEFEYEKISSDLDIIKFLKLRPVLTGDLNIDLFALIRTYSDIYSNPVILIYGLSQYFNKNEIDLFISDCESLEITILIVDSHNDYCYTNCKSLFYVGSTLNNLEFSLTKLNFTSLSHIQYIYLNELINSNLFNDVSASEIYKIIEEFPK